MCVRVNVDIPVLLQCCLGRRGVTTIKHNSRPKKYSSLLYSVLTFIQSNSLKLNVKGPSFALRAVPTFCGPISPLWNGTICKEMINECQHNRQIGVHGREMSNRLVWSISPKEKKKQRRINLPVAQPTSSDLNVARLKPVLRNPQIKQRERKKGAYRIPSGFFAALSKNKSYCASWKKHLRAEEKQKRRFLSQETQKPEKRGKGPLFSFGALGKGPWNYNKNRKKKRRRNSKTLYNQPALLR